MPKSEQIEYKNLVKRMAELERIKQARQTTFNLSNKLSAPVKDTLKPRNITVDASKLSAINNLEEKITISRYYFINLILKLILFLFINFLPNT